MPTNASSTAVVILPKVATASTTTPRKSPRKERATEKHTRPDGSSMYLTVEELAKLRRAEIVPVPEEKAHCLSRGLLFRYYHTTSQGTLGQNGFRAGRMPLDDIPSPPMPPLDSPYFPWDSFFYHINRDKVSSPFISTSNNFFWILRLAAKEAKKGLTGGRIAVIDASAIDYTQIYHAYPFHAELLKKRVFRNGAHRYRGSFEYLVYYRIPASAILHTFSPEDDLFRARATDRANGITALLQQKTIALNASYQTRLRKDLVQSDLTPGTLNAIARIAKRIGLGKNSSTDHIAHLVGGLIRGFAVRVERLPAEEWQQNANVFAQVFISPQLPTLYDIQRMKLVFLEGVKASCGIPNADRTPETIRLRERKAKRIGLESPSKIIADELDGAKLQILSGLSGPPTAATTRVWKPVASSGAQSVFTYNAVTDIDELELDERVGIDEVEMDDDNDDDGDEDGVVNEDDDENEDDEIVFECADLDLN